MTHSNDNGRCPETGCHYAAGTACSAFMCPGRALKNMHRASSNPRVCMGGEVPPLSAPSPTLFPVNSHDAVIAQVQA